MISFTCVFNRIFIASLLLVSMSPNINAMDYATRHHLMDRYNESCYCLLKDIPGLGTTDLDTERLNSTKQAIMSNRKEFVQKHGGKNQQFHDELHNLVYKKAKELYECPFNEMGPEVEKIIQYIITQLITQYSRNFDVTPDPNKEKL